MKNRVISMWITVMLITLLFCACTAEENLAATEPTQMQPHTETEALYGSAHQVLEQVFDGDGHLTEDRICSYDEQGNLTESAVTVYDAADSALSYQKKIYGDGSLTSSLTKQYTGGALTQQVEVFYFENQSPRSVSKWEFSGSGTLLRRSHRRYGETGELLAEETEYLDDHTGFRVIREESYHENGNPARLHSGIHHRETLRLLDGKIEDFDESGNLIRSEEALWDGEARTGFTELYEYGAEGAVLFAQQTMQCYDSLGRETVYEVTTYEQGSAFSGHRVEYRSFDDAGQLTENEICHYREDGTPSEQYVYTYRYDSAGNLIYEQNIHHLTPGVRQNLTVTEYTYDENGNLTGEKQTGYDDADAQQFQTIKEYDADGKVASFVTVSNLGNRYTYTYTYDEIGRLSSELLTTEYRYGSRIDYQETAWQYHENGNYKTVSLHKWTSHDEAKYPNADKSDLGKTTVTEYDEEGNKI